MSCPKCGGTVGWCSDICLDCNYDTATFTLRDWLMVTFLAVVLAAGLIEMTL